MTTLTVPARPAVRSGGPSAAATVGLEIRKSVSTRSGKAVAFASAALAPAATTMLSFTGDPLDAVRGPLGALGMVTGLVLITLGVLVTATEWGHRTAETTFLLEPRRGRVVLAKYVAAAVMGAVIAAIAVAGSAAVLAVVPGVGDPSWAGASLAIGISVAAGAAFAVIGAGVGAAFANTPAALTGLYLTILGAMPAVRIWQPEVADALDPSNAVLQLATGNGTTGHLVTMAGWVAVTAVAGVVLTRRRAVS